MAPGDEHSPVPPSNEPGGSDQATKIPTEPEIGELANQGGSSAPEIGVSWVYKLRKEELTQELQKFRLDTSGTVEEQRKRLIMFLRVGRASPQPQLIPTPFMFPAPTPVPRPTSSTVTSTPLDPLSIRKWNIQFNGKGDPAAFIERLGEVCAYANFDPNQLLPVLPELLQGTPLLWYRNNKRFWRTWTDFVRDFRTLYFPVNYLEDLEAEIGRRLQQADESVATYLTDLQTLIRRHGGMTPDQELRWLYRNLLPDYRQYIKKTDFTDVPTLTQRVKEFEVLRQELQQMNLNSKPQKETTPRLPDRLPWRSYNATTGARPIQAPRLSAPVRHPDLRRPVQEPSTSRPTTEAGNQVPAATNRSVPVNSNLICWRCGETGHVRTHCNSRPKLFCSRCGREGTTTRDCDCRAPEN